MCSVTPPAETPARAYWCRRPAAGRAPATVAAARNSGGGRSSSCRRSRAAAPAASSDGPADERRRAPGRDVDRPLEAPADVEEPPAVAARHVLHLHAAEGREVGDHAVQMRPARRRTGRGRAAGGVLMQLIENPPGVDRQPVANDARRCAGARSASRAAGRRAASRLKKTSACACFELAAAASAPRSARGAAPGRPARAARPTARGGSRSYPRSVRRATTLRSSRTYARRARRSGPARTGCRPRGSAGRCRARSQPHREPAGASSVTRAHRSVGQHPGVLAAAAALHRDDRHVAACSTTRVSPPGITT